MEKVKNVAIVIVCVIVGAVIMYAGVSFGGRRGQTQTEPAATQVTETEVEAPASEDVERPADTKTVRTEATTPAPDNDQEDDLAVADDNQETVETTPEAVSDEDYALEGYVVFMEVNSIGYAFKDDDAKWVSQNIGDDSSWCRGLEAALKGSAIPTSEGPVFYCDGKTAADFELAWGGAKVYVMPSGTNTWALAKAAMASAEEAGTYECEYGTYTVYAK